MFTLGGMLTSEKKHAFIFFSSIQYFLSILIKLPKRLICKVRSTKTFCLPKICNALGLLLPYKEPIMYSIIAIREYMQLIK